MMAWGLPGPLDPRHQPLGPPPKTISVAEAQAPDVSQMLQKGISSLLPSLGEAYKGVHGQMSLEKSGSTLRDIANNPAAMATSLSAPGGPYAAPAGGGLDPAGKLPSFAGGTGTKTMPAAPEVAQSVVKHASAAGLNPEDVLTAMSYETGGTLDPWKKGPTTKWGTHRGLIQWGEPQAQQYGITQQSTVDEQVAASIKYLQDRGVKPGMGMLEIYSAINAGGVGPQYAGRSDTAAGGAPGTVADKVNNQMAGHRARAAALLKTTGGDTGAAVAGGMRTAPDLIGVAAKMGITPEQLSRMGDTPEFLEAMRTGRMKPSPNDPSIWTIDGKPVVRPDWNEVLKSIPKDAVWQATPAQMQRGTPIGAPGIPQPGATPGVPPPQPTQVASLDPSIGVPGGPAAGTPAQGPGLFTVPGNAPGPQPVAGGGLGTAGQPQTPILPPEAQGPGPTPAAPPPAPPTQTAAPISTAAPAAATGAPPAPPQPAPAQRPPAAPAAQAAAAMSRDPRFLTALSYAIESGDSGAVTGVINAMKQAQPEYGFTKGEDGTIYRTDNQGNITPAIQGPGPGIVTMPPGDPRRRQLGIPDSETRPVQVDTRSGKWDPVNPAPATSPPAVQDGFQFNPQTGRYDIPVGPSGAKAPAFNTKTVEGQALNRMVESGRITVQQADDLATGKSITTPDGSIYFFRGSDLLGIPAGSSTAAPVTPGGPAPAAAPGQLGTPLTPPKVQNLPAEVTGRLAAAKTFIEGQSPNILTEDNINLLASPKGKAQAFAGYGDAGEMTRQIGIAADLYLRIMSGAGTNKEEAKKYATFFEPKPWDNAETIKRKVTGLRNILTDIHTATTSGRNLDPDQLLKLGRDHGAGGDSGVPKVKDDADYNRLKSGDYFEGPDGVTRRKP
jgi:hypothetical protein